MAMIFDRFQTRKHAEEFARATSRFGSRVYDSQVESDQDDPFPFVLDGPVVLVDRQSPQMEDLLMARVRQYGGEYAGT